MTERRKRARGGAQSTQRTAEPLSKVERRAEAIIADVSRFDIDTRAEVSRVLKNLTFYRSSGGGYFTAEELLAGRTTNELELREAVRRVDAGERVTVSGATADHDAAARAVISLLDDHAIPDFFRDAISDLLVFFAADVGAKLWHETTEGEMETGGFSIDTLARSFAHHQMHRLEIERKKDIAELISAVLKHPDTPSDVYNGITRGVQSLKHDASAPGFIRHVLDSESKEMNG